MNLQHTHTHTWSFSSSQFTFRCMSVRIYAGHECESVRVCRYDKYIYMGFDVKVAARMFSVMAKCVISSHRLALAELQFFFYPSPTYLNNFSALARFFWDSLCLNTFAFLFSLYFVLAQYLLCVLV